jgi:hypothetical protein
MSWSGAFVLYDSGPPLAQRNNKRGHAGARKPMFTVPTVPPQTLATKSDREGAEARGTAHHASDYNRDRHRHHVILLIGSRYIYVIPRL